MPTALAVAGMTRGTSLWTSYSSVSRSRKALTSITPLCAAVSARLMPAFTCRPIIEEAFASWHLRSRSLSVMPLKAPLNQRICPQA
jgi:hypothetical protein